jgi:hypothetical protein
MPLKHLGAFWVVEDEMSDALLWADDGSFHAAPR